MQIVESNTKTLTLLTTAGDYCVVRIRAAAARSWINAITLLLITYFYIALGMARSPSLIINRNEEATRGNHTVL